MMRRPQVPEDLCKEILGLDKNIRFAALADKFGKILMMEYRERMAPLLSKEEQAVSIIQATIRMGSLKTMLGKLGKLVYAFALYEKVKRATIPLSNYSILLISFETRADHESIILKKIIPFLKKRRLL